MYKQTIDKIKWIKKIGELQMISKYIYVNKHSIKCIPLYI